MLEDGVEDSFTITSIDSLLVYEKKQYLKVYLENYACILVSMQMIDKNYGNLSQPDENLYTPTRLFNWKINYVRNVRIWSLFGLCFPILGLNTEKYSVPLSIQSEWGKIQIRKTPNTGTFFTKSKTAKNVFVTIRILIIGLSFKNQSVMIVMIC